MKKSMSMLLMVMVLVVSVFSGCSKEVGNEGDNAEVTNEVRENEGEETSTSDYPTKTITAICPWSAGGGTDTVLRGLAKGTEEFLGQTITVTNQTGGGGAVGHTAIQTAENDGYTVGMITFELSSLPAQGLVDFTYEDFVPLMRVNMEPAAITVSADSQFNSIKEFLDYAKEHPGEINIGNSGIGATWHVAAGLLEQVTETQFGHVPFDGAAPAITALVGGHVDAVSVSPSEVQAQVEAGDLKILAVMDTERTELFPEVPTMIEEGYEVSFGTWRGLAVPVGTPDHVVATLSDAFKKGIESEEFVEYAQNAGLTIAYQNAEDFKAFLAKNAEEVAVAMEALGLAAE